MFWKFDLITSSHLEALLDKEDVTLSELLDEDDVLQECKAQNRRSHHKMSHCVKCLLSLSRVRTDLHSCCLWVFLFFLIRRLLQFLCQDQCMQELVRMITTEPPAGIEDIKRFK